MSDGDIERWRQAHARGGSEPSNVEVFVPFDTSLVLYQPLVDELTKSYGRNLQRLAVGLPAFVMQASGTGKVSLAEIEGWEARIGPSPACGRRALKTVGRAFDALDRVDLARCISSESSGTPTASR